MPETKPLTGYPSIDKPWLKYYSEKAINAPIPEMSIFEWIKHRNTDNYNNIAVNYLGYKITYGELFSQIEKAAAGFISLGVKPHDIVTLALPNTPEYLISIYALNLIGAITNLIDLRCQGDDLIGYYNEVDSAYAVVCDLFLANTLAVANRTNLKAIIVTSPYDHLFLPLRTFLKSKHRIPKRNDIHLFSWREFIKNGHNCSLPTVYAKAEDTACIVHTSGTTGASKGVMLSNKCFNAVIVQVDGYLKYARGDRFFNHIPTFLAYNAVFATHLPLSLRMEMIMMPDYKPDHFVKNVLKYKVNFAVVGPADMYNFLDEKAIKKNTDFSFVKTLASGSDSLRPDKKNSINRILELHGCTNHIMEGYGMTEVGSAAATCLPSCDVSGSVGIPYPLDNFCVWDNDNNTELPINTKGEICISGPTLMNGYYKRPEETEAVLRIHDDGILWMHSGDLGYIDENGCIFLDGRLKRVIVQYNGMKINPFEVEKTLLKDEGVRECCVVGAPDKEHKIGSLPVAFIVSSTESSNEELEKRLQALCDANLLERYRPVYYSFIDALPLTPTGKVDYRALETLAEE